MSQSCGGHLFTDAGSGGSSFDFLERGVFSLAAATELLKNLKNRSGLRQNF